MRLGASRTGRHRLAYFVYTRESPITSDNKYEMNLLRLVSQSWTNNIAKGFTIYRENLILCRKLKAIFRPTTNVVPSKGFSPLRWALKGNCTSFPFHMASFSQ
jgi:hypothetical protein